MYDIENYYNAETIKEAVTLLKEHPDARVISGGSDVLIKIREGKMAGTSLVSIRDIKEIKGILTGEAEPDYVRCVEISTAGAQHEMIWPSVLAVITPICMGIVFGVPGVFGLLAGGLASGFVLAVFMANSGGAWDNAKKYIEQGHVGGKGSESHKAAVIGDTVGDPFKDTSGPSLNILIKLMSMVAIVTAGVNIAVTLF